MCLETRNYIILSLGIYRILKSNLKERKKEMNENTAKLLKTVAPGTFSFYIKFSTNVDIATSISIHQLSGLIMTRLANFNPSCWLYFSIS